MKAESASMMCTISALSAAAGFEENPGLHIKNRSLYSGRLGLCTPALPRSPMREIGLVQYLQ